MSVDDPSAPWHRPGSGRTQWEEGRRPIDIFGGIGTDRVVHAWGKSGEVVRYDKAGKWYWEPKVGKRKALTLAEAVDKGMWCWYDDAGTVCMGRPGGRAFDRKVIARCEAKTDD